MAKIIARIRGGIGNQIFIYAAARRLALINDSELVLDSVSGFVHDLQYRQHYQLDHFHIPCRKATPAERFEPFSRVRRYLKRQLNQRLPFEQRRYVIQESIDFDPRLIEFKPRGTVHLEGYWQSEDYFKDIEATIRQDLQIQPPTDPTNLAIVQHIHQHTSVAVHIRFFDQPDIDSMNNAPSDYYHRAVEVMETFVPGAHYYLFSDQPEPAKSRIPLSDERVTLVNHNRGNKLAYADLWLMTQCEHFIIANSTFSWWGAWLAENQKKQVIAPGFEKREGVSWWGFQGLLPKQWIKL